jgi:phosphoribosyl 1,2-cyclic phosphodiesterase
MQFTSYASGSAGNLYALDDGQTSLIIECGLPYKHIQRLLPKAPSEYDACLITHEHGDHAKAALDLAKRIPVYCSGGTADKIRLAPETTESVTAGQTVSIGTMSIKSFAVEHDAAEPLGFMIRSTSDGDSMLFATDTFYLRHRFPRLTIWAIECNYAHDLIPDGCTRADRLVSSHMSLSQCIETLKAHDLSATREIHLLHMSDDHSDEARFLGAVQAATGIPTYAAPQRGWK